MCYVATTHGYVYKNNKHVCPGHERNCNVFVPMHGHEDASKHCNPWRGHNDGKYTAIPGL
eukprot:7582276-Lingulodinium_polyedra.AAC.1